MDRPPRRKFVVTGSGRSGTEYIALTLSAAGLRCGHEAVFGPRTRTTPAFGAWDGDASWLAAPFLAALPSSTVVLHQVRHPFAVISSWYGLRFLADDGPYSLTRPSGVARLIAHELKTRAQRARGTRVFVARDYERFVARHLPWAMEATSTLDRCMRYWVGWNEMVEAGAARSGSPYLRYHLEEIDSRWAEIVELLGLDPAVGASPPPTVGSDAAGSKRPNARHHHDVLTEDLFAASPEFDRVAEVAARYGFEVR